MADLPPAERAGPFQNALERSNVRGSNEGLLCFVTTM